MTWIPTEKEMNEMARLDAEENNCLECGNEITGFASDHGQKVCGDCQEVLDR